METTNRIIDDDHDAIEIDDDDDDICANVIDISSNSDSDCKL